jgi:hypothetical protein
MSLCCHPIISVFLFPVSTAKKSGVAVRICEALQMICSASLALCNSSPIGAATFAAPHSVGVQNEKFASFSHKSPRVFQIGAASL